MFSVIINSLWSILKSTEKNAPPNSVRTLDLFHIFYSYHRHNPYIWQKHQVYKNEIPKSNIKIVIVKNCCRETVFIKLWTSLFVTPRAVELGYSWNDWHGQRTALHACTVDGRNRKGLLNGFEPLLSVSRLSSHPKLSSSLTILSWGLGVELFLSSKRDDGFRYLAKTFPYFHKYKPIAVYKILI